MIHVGEVGSLCDQGAHRDSVTSPVSGWNLVDQGQHDNLAAATEEETIGSDEESIGALARNTGKSRVDLADRRSVEDLDLQPEGGGGFLHSPQNGLGGRRIS